MTNRYPTFTRAGVVAGVGLAVELAKHFGVVIPSGEANAIVDLISVGGPLVVAVWSMRHTTPLADPRTETGEALVPASVANPPAPPTPASLAAAWEAFQAAAVPVPPLTADPAPIVAAPPVAVAPVVAAPAVEPAPVVAAPAVAVEADRPAPSQVTEWSPTA